MLNGALRSGSLLAATGASRETLANAYRREARQVLRFGQARATRYAGRHQLPGLETDEFPVFRLDEGGNIRPADQLVTLVATESVWLPDPTVIDGLPPEMHDIAPKGFLGRSYARHNDDLGLPEDVANWSDNHVLIALSRRGEDLPGNLVIGRESFARFQELRHEVHTTEDFPRLSEKAIAGEHVGSSAGGEQPKFTAFLDGEHRIVKFATDVTDNARRWQDLLLLEHIALQTLQDSGIDTAQTRILDMDGLRCLVVDRFDRVGERGRRRVITLAAPSGNVAGSWTDSAEQMHRRGELNDEGLHRIALLEAFGALIANTDRHHHNVSLFPTDDGYVVAPAYDQLPMAYAPPASGNLRMAAIRPPHAAVNTLQVWNEAHVLARKFWRRAADQQLSNSMAAIVREHAS
ncbi:MAG: HipA domain-containing protein [Woeseiaceae bacterium]|nr:HipA domain-containing protein [Woeseiaceae bacterium]